MNSFKVEGSIKLSGDITPQGAKNEALQVLCAVLLTKERFNCIFSRVNYPFIKS